MRATIEYTVDGAANMEELIQKATEVYSQLVADPTAILPAEANLTVQEENVQLAGSGVRISTTWQADVTIRTRVGE